MIRKIAFTLLVALMSLSCATNEKVLYFQDAKIDTLVEYNVGKDVALRPGDAISIVVNSRDANLAALYNLPRVEQATAGSSSASSYSTGDVIGYTINAEGNIDFPVIGAINVVGLSKHQVEMKIKKMLIEGEYVLDPVVTVNYLNLKYSIMGEVNTPGQYNINEDKMTILDAISRAGDLSIYAERDGLFLTRITDQGRITYQMDMKSVDLYNSPGFYLQQGDIIYVKPSKIRARQSTANGNSLSSASFWMSVASVLTTITVLFVN